MTTWDPELMECVTRCKCGRASDVEKTSNPLQLSETMDMVATGQEIVREKKNSSRSGKSQGISL